VVSPFGRLSGGQLRWSSVAAWVGLMRNNVVDFMGGLACNLGGSSVLQRELWAHVL